MFFGFSQNNSGGYYLEDKALGVTSYIYVEAETGEEALTRFNEIREAYNESHMSSFDSYCSCCGERWSDDYGVDDEDGELLGRLSSWQDYSIVFLDGSIQFHEGEGI